MKNKNIIQVVAFCVLALGFSSTYGQIFYGAGNDEGVTVISSATIDNSAASNTLNGGGMDAKLMEASRFLSQTTFGSSYADIVAVNELGFENWIDNQLALPMRESTPMMWEIWNEIEQLHEDNFEHELAEYIQELCSAYYEDDTGTVEEPEPLTQEEVDDLRERHLENLFGPASFEFNITWSQLTYTAEDQLRQRMAYALSQIMVISTQSELGSFAESVTGFYDILQRHAFGNFRDLLLDVTLSPAMGFYLSHLNNPKAVPEENIHPDENYAREIMQLFSIGLFELNLDGSRKKDANGNDIPTYNNADIKELARVFTGLGPAELDPTMDIDSTEEANFGLNLYAMHKSNPLIMYQDWHDEGSKSALNGLEIPAGLNGMEEIEMTVDFLFNHPNVAPFICRQLIQRLVTSNPSRQYIERVAQIFENNGQGVRGDLGAVVKAIILDEEARSCDGFLDPVSGKLSEPVLRTTRFGRSVPHLGVRYRDEIVINNYSCSGIDTIGRTEELVFDDLRLWDNGYGLYEDVKQYPMMSPTVFNFYLPDHQPVGEILDQGLFGPEFKIHDSSTAINYMNYVWMIANPYYNLMWYNWLEGYGVESIMPDYEDLLTIYNEEPEKLINHLDIVLTNGKLSDSTRNAIRQYLNESPAWVDNLGHVRTIVYLILISPDYTIDK